MCRIRDRKTRDVIWKQGLDTKKGGGPGRLLPGTSTCIMRRGEEMPSRTRESMRDASTVRETPLLRH